MSEQEKRDAAMNPKESVSSSKDAKEAKKAKAPAKKKEKWSIRLRRWLKDLKGELKKVTWPSAKDTMKSVGVVILCVIIVGIFIWVFDFLARAVVDALLNLFA